MKIPDLLNILDNIYKNEYIFTYDQVQEFDSSLLSSLSISSYMSLYINIFNSKNIYINFISFQTHPKTRKILTCIGNGYASEHCPSIQIYKTIVNILKLDKL